jgi:acyl-CoA thioesterase-1
MRLRKFYLILLTFISLPVWASPQTLVVYGDSLSAGYGIDVREGWVSLLGKKLDDEYPNQFMVINASVSGETTTGGKNRLAGILQKHQPSVVILELGGNDGLQGQAILSMRKNLEQMIEQITQAHAKTLLIGIQIPPNYGSRYTQQFAAIFPSLAKERKVPLVPFLLEGIATDKTLMQRDGIHPTQEAQAQILNNVWPHLSLLLTSATNK